MASYLDRRSPSGAEDAVGGVGCTVRFAASTDAETESNIPGQRRRSVRSSGGRERGRESERGREKEYARGWMRDRGRLMGERGVGGGG